MQISVKR